MVQKTPEQVWKVVISGRVCVKRRENSGVRMGVDAVNDALWRSGLTKGEAGAQDRFEMSNGGVVSTMVFFQEWACDQNVTGSKVLKQLVARGLKQHGVM